MIRVLVLSLLLFYYWYFYAYTLKHIEKPAINVSPKPYNFKFHSKQSNHFQFIVDGISVWEHTLPSDTFKFHRDKIVAIDPCHGSPNGQLIPAMGKVLYEYLKSNPDSSHFLKFKENSPFTVQHGHVFYYKCSNGHIENVGMCPSGTTLVKGICQAINSCTNKPDGTLLPHVFEGQYIVCFQGKENVKKCPDQHIFHHNRCEPMRDLTHYCKMFPNEHLKLDETTILLCKKGKPYFRRCKPGFRFFDNLYCEPANCHDLTDGTKLPLPEQKNHPFKFIPGFMMCKGGKVDRTFQCSKQWDEMLSKGDNLTFLPLVFDGEKCSVPSFCENVFSDESDTIVPVHEFTKYVKNWNLSSLFDQTAGFTCENKIRKRKHLAPDTYISKRFKEEPACGPSMPIHLPINGEPQKFYDCTTDSISHCPPDHIFNGSACIPEPKNAFSFNRLPLFQFDSLNFESWIQPWDYSKSKQISCRDPESTHIHIYNICSHPDCSQYAFVSQIPDLAILLPQEQRAKCKFYENEKTLKKEPVDFDYTFWNQKVLDKSRISKREIMSNVKAESCIPGQKLQTGNFIWDSTIYATCNTSQPFVFCPSTHSQRIIPSPDGHYFACEPPKTITYDYDNVGNWTHFETNEIKRVLPKDDNTNTVVRRNKSDKPHLLTKDGLELSKGEKVNLLVNHSVVLEPRYRVTHPPNVVFEYDDQHQMQIKTTTPDHAFLTKLENFTSKHLTFPRFKPISFVEHFNQHLYV